MRHTASAENSNQRSCERIAPAYNTVPNASTQTVDVTLLRKIPVNFWHFATYNVFFGAIEIANTATCPCKPESASEVQSTERLVSLSPESPARAVLAR